MNMAFQTIFFIIVASYTCYPAVSNPRSAALNINNNYLGESTPADAINTHDVHETMYVHLKAISSRNNDPASQPYNCFQRDGITSATSSTILQIHLNASSIFKNYPDSFLVTTTVILLLQQLPDMHS